MSEALPSRPPHAAPRSTPAGVRDAPHELLTVSDIERRPVRLAIDAFPTVLAAVDALGGRDHVDPALMRAVTARLDARDRAALHPVIIRPGRFIPSSLLPRPSGLEGTPAEALERLRAVSPDEFLSELEILDVLGPWAEAARAPRAWLRAYHRALERCWQALAPFWTNAAPLLEREVERVAAALVRGSISDLIIAAQADGAVRDGAIAFPSIQREIAVSPAGLVLTPKLLGSRAHVLRFYDDAGMTHLAYRAPGVQRLAGVTAPPGSLVALIGGPRATVLRELDRPLTVGALAERLLAVPSAATHHVDALQNAGLVSRERQGRSVLVRRTAKGTSLLALYER